MNGLMLVAQREARVQVRTKGFIIGLIVSALVVAGIVVGPRLLGSDDTYRVGFEGDASQVLQPALTSLAAEGGITVKAATYHDEAAARTAVVDGDADAAVVDGSTILADGELEPRLEAVVQGAHRAVRSEQQLTAAGLDPGQVHRALQVRPLDQVSVTGDTRYDDARQGMALLIVLALFVLILGSAMGVAMGVVEEKSSRIVEILLIAVRPWQLLAGKTIAHGALGLIHLAVVASVGLAATGATGGLGDLPPGTPGIIAGAFVGFLLGYAFFTAMAAALGALVSRQEELSGALGPMNLLIMATYFVAFWAVGNPNSTVSEVLSVVPPFSSIVMPVRAAATDVATWQIGAAVVLMLAAVTVVLVLGARIYERAVLRTGARVKLTEALRVPDELATQR